jgi:hypothetical protein
MFLTQFISTVQALTYKIMGYKTLQYITENSDFFQKKSNSEQFFLNLFDNVNISVIFHVILVPTVFKIVIS